MKISSSDMSESYILASAQTEDGMLLDAEICRKILELYTVDSNQKAVAPTEALQNHLTQQIAELQEEVKGRNTDAYLDKKDLLERQYKDKIVEYEMKVDKLDTKIRDLQKTRAPSRRRRLSSKNCQRSPNFAQKSPRPQP